MASEPLPTPPRRSDRVHPTDSEERVARLVREHQRAVLAYLTSLGCPGELVEDLAQDTFVAALRGGFAERDDASTRAWLRTVARSRWLDHVRRARRSASADPDEVDAAWRCYEGEDGGASYREALQVCLAGLEPRDRRALELRYGQGLGRADVASALGLSLGGVKALLARSLGRLRVCIERRLP